MVGSTRCFLAPVITRSRSLYQGAGYTRSYVPSHSTSHRVRDACRRRPHVENNVDCFMTPLSIWPLQRENVRNRVFSLSLFFIRRSTCTAMTTDSRSCSVVLDEKVEQHATGTRRTLDI